MRDYPYVCGADIHSIANKEFMRFETANASKICIALDKSGVPFSARYSDNEIVLTFDGSYKEQVGEIIEKAQSGNYEAMLRELQTYGMPDSYFRLLGDVAELFNTSVSALQNRPQDIQLMLCKTYADFWLCDNATIQRELDRIITVNGRTLQDIQEYEKGKAQEKSPKIPEKSTADNLPTFSEIADDYFRRNTHAHFTRESHKHLSEIARRRQQADHENAIQTEEIERRKRP